MTKVIATIICLLAFSTSSHSSPLPLFKAEYDAIIKGFEVKATRELKPLENDQFELRFYATSWLAKIDESSVFQWQNNYIKPASYNYSQTALGKEKQRSISFDYDSATATYLEQGNSSAIELLENTFDNLSYQLQLQLDISSNKNLDYKIINKGSIKDYSFEVLHEETIETKAGKLTAVKVKVIRKNNSKKFTYIWFAKDWKFLLAKLEQYEGDKKKFAILLNNAVVNQQTVKGL